ncbi:MAG: UvrD-helicase domain-containing protein [Burkholderiales bacterium]|nr:UvrD-helicase domain-containing protein [Burkholderiales bacterium]
MSAAYRADGRPCSRDDFYALACDPARSVVVEACAGAGKTWLLVSRILRALLAGAQPQEILAITFTRKAAGEMRARLAQWLQAFAFADRATRVAELRERGFGEAEARAAEPALAQLHDRVLASGRAVEISTFHAWFSQLMRAAPREMLDGLGLQPGMALLEDSAELLPDLMRAFHGALAADASTLDAYTEMLARMGRQRLNDALFAALQQRVEIELADQAGHLLDAVPAAAVLWPGYPGWADAALQSALDAAARALGQQAGKKAQDAALALRDVLQTSDPQLAFGVAWSALFTTDDEPRKLGDAPALQAALDALQQHARWQAQQDAHEDHHRMVRLTRVLLAEWRALKRARALADMPDLERCALALLSDPVVSGAVQQRLDARVRHLLIDEFQDTSPLQWHALLSWLSGYAGAGGGRDAPSVFIVGDPKQSIYRFRRAEPRVFEAAREFVVLGLDGIVLECDHTRRNAPGVTAVLNPVFEQAQAEGAFSGFRPHSTEVADGPMPALASLPRTARPPLQRSDKNAPPAPWRDTLTTPRREADAVLRSQEAAQVAAAIVELVVEQGVAPQGILVLARKRAMLGLVADALRERHVPCVAAESLQLADLPEARDLIALLDALASPAHDLSLATALKSPLFGVSDAELLALSQRARAMHRPWSTALRIWVDAPASLARARGLFARWRPLARILPPHDLLDRVVHEAEALDRMVTAAAPERRGLARQAVQSMLAQALALDGGRYATPYGFVRALRRRPIKVPVLAAGNAVRLLTLHGAKGLESDHVFVVDTDPEPRTDSDPGLLVDWPVDAQAPQRVAFLSQRNRVPPSLQALAAAEQAIAAREELNLLYVALTRARQRLVISATAPRRVAGLPSWWDRLALSATAWQPALARQAAGAGASAQVPLLPAAPLAETPPSSEAATDEAAARLGQAIHRVLEWATGPAGGRNDRAALAAAAREFALDSAAAAEVLRVAGRVLDSPELAPFFDPAGLDWAGNEVPVAHGGEALRIDRLVRRRDDGHWWVLDYKLGATPQQVAAHRTQLGRYRDAVAALYPGQGVNAAFISGQGQLIALD